MSNVFVLDTGCATVMLRYGFDIVESKVAPNGCVSLGVDETHAYMQGNVDLSPVQARELASKLLSFADMVEKGELAQVAIAGK